MASTAANRAAFIKSVLTQLQSYGFDGLDIVPLLFFVYLLIADLPERTGVGASIAILA